MLYYVRNDIIYIESKVGFACASMWTHQKQQNLWLLVI